MAQIILQDSFMKTGSLVKENQRNNHIKSVFGLINQGFSYQTNCNIYVKYYKEYPGISTFFLPHLPEMGLRNQLEGGLDIAKTDFGKLS